MYRDIETKIENTIMQERVNDDGETVNYIIFPCDGYKLHEKTRDEIEMDEYGNETGKIIKGYTNGIVTVFVDYDFEKNPREIYSRLENSEDEIITKDDTIEDSKIIEKAKAYDILMGVDE